MFQALEKMKAPKPKRAASPEAMRKAATKRGGGAPLDQRAALAADLG